MLVETIVKLVLGIRCLVFGANILELGTGSGCIAVSLAKFLPGAKITATDISREALEVAKENTILNNVEINFLQGDLFNTYNLKPNTYDLIVSNPPYIPTKEIRGLEAEVQYEPRLALDGAEDGLDFYRRLIKDSPAYLKKGGFLIMEMGFGQAEAIKNIFQSAGNFAIIEVVKDYSNIERVVVVRRRWIN